ncbi:MAG: hypothetical protein RBS08_05870 [Bdellovibrionales bacterium]|nr:hypothetical protein [Bdellovibrionales bacterium]
MLFEKHALFFNIGLGLLFLALLGGSNVLLAQTVARNLLLRSFQERTGGCCGGTWLFSSLGHDFSLLVVNGCVFFSHIWVVTQRYYRPVQTLDFSDKRQFARQIENLLFRQVNFIPLPRFNAAEIGNVLILMSQLFFDMDKLPAGHAKCPCFVTGFRAGECLLRSSLLFKKGLSAPCRLLPVRKREDFAFPAHGTLCINQNKGTDKYFLYGRPLPTACRLVKNMEKEKWSD